MKAKQRRFFAKLIKELKLPVKLYRGSKLAAYKRLNKFHRQELGLKLLFSKPGMVVNDCDYTNHVVKGFVSYNKSGKSKFKYRLDGWALTRSIRGYILDLPQVEFEDGRWSCGCNASPCGPMTREDIEKTLLNMYKEPWYELTDNDKDLLAVLSSGDHILDERGVLLPQYQRFRME